MSHQYFQSVFCKQVNFGNFKQSRFSLNKELIHFSHVGGLQIMESGWTPNKAFVILTDPIVFFYSWTSTASMESHQSMAQCSQIIQYYWSGSYYKKPWQTFKEVVSTETLSVLDILDHVVCKLIHMPWCPETQQKHCVRVEEIMNRFNRE